MISYRSLVAENKSESSKLLYHVRFSPVMKLQKTADWVIFDSDKLLNLYGTEFSVGDFYILLENKSKLILSRQVF